MHARQNSSGKIITSLFLVLIVIFAFIASYYLYKNDFNKETLGVIFPAVGAIALTLYLGVKSIWIDAPEAVESRTNIVLIHDTNGGIVHSLVTPAVMPSTEHVFKFRGLKKIMEYRVYNTLKDLPVWEDLKSNNMEKSDEIIAHFLEFAFLDWLTQQHTTMGHIDRGTVVGLQGASGSYGVHENLVPLEGVSVDLGEREWNPFIKANNISLRLPKNSKVVREKLEGPFFRFLVETPNSEVEFRVLSKSGGTFSMSLEPLARKIRAIFNIPEITPNLQAYAMPVEIITRVKPFSRHSDQAKIEREWHKKLAEYFEVDYSWDKLKDYYVSL